MIPGVEILVDMNAIANYTDRVQAVQMFGFPMAKQGLIDGMEVMRLDWMLYLRDVRKDMAYFQEVAERGVEYPYLGSDVTARITAGVRGSQIEFGAPAWDMKPSILKRAKSGKTYVNVMFRHGHPGVTTMRFPPMSKEVYSEAKAFEAYRSSGYDPKIHRLKPPPIVGGGTIAQQGQRVKMLLPEAGPVIRAMGERRYHWQTGIWNDLVRLGNHNPATGRTDSQYVTWRRVSINSPAPSWWYPRIDPNPVIPEIIARNEGQLRNKVVRGMMMDLGL